MNKKPMTKAQAEARKLEAQAQQAVAEARRAEAEARKADAEARSAEVDARKAEESEAARRAGDEFNHVYRFNSDVGSASVSACCAKLTEWGRRDPGCDMEIIFRSPGGGIIAGMALFDFIQRLRHEGHTITTGTEGMAASMAGILLQAGDVRWVGEQSWVLIHRASFLAFGSTDDVEDELKLVQRMEKRIIGIFVARTGGRLTAQRIKRNWRRKDWWLEAEELKDLGLVDEVRGALKVS